MSVDLADLPLIERPRSPDTIAVLRASCQACELWDRRESGCRTFRACERRSKTESLWRVGECPRDKWPRKRGE